MRIPEGLWKHSGNWCVAREQGSSPEGSVIWQGAPDGAGCVPARRKLEPVKRESLPTSQELQSRRWPGKEQRRAPQAESPLPTSCHPYSDRHLTQNPPGKNSAPSSLLPPCAPTAGCSQAGGAGAKEEGQTCLLPASPAGAIMAGEVETMASRSETWLPHKAGQSNRTF